MFVAPWVFLTACVLCFAVVTLCFSNSLLTPGVSNKDSILLLTKGAEGFRRAEGLAPLRGDFVLLHFVR